MNTVEQILLAYYNYCKVVKQKYKELYPEFDVITLSDGITLLSKN